MKTLVKISMVLLFAVCSFSNLKAQSATNDNELIGKARAAAHECLAPYAGTDINGFVSNNDPCGSTVTFSSMPRCVGNGPCPFFAILVATVVFDCNGNVVSVTCL